MHGQQNIKTRLTLPKQLFCLFFAVGLTNLGRPRFVVRSP